MITAIDQLFIKTIDSNNRSHMSHFENCICIINKNADCYINYAIFNTNRSLRRLLNNKSAESDLSTSRSALETCTKLGCDYVDAQQHMTLMHWVDAMDVLVAWGAGAVGGGGVGAEAGEVGAFGAARGAADGEEGDGGSAAESRWVAGAGGDSLAAGAGRREGQAGTQRVH